ncbi:MAG: hypothetical protein GY851_25415 [bacterium]|nr:hypothetical protein [bacterium]
MMRTRCVPAVVALCLVTVWTAGADVPNVASGDLTAVFKTLRGDNLIDNPRKATTSAGYLRFLSAPAGNYFEQESQTKTADPGAAAKGFMLDHAGAFGMPSPNLDYDVERVNTAPARTYVRLQQQYMGLDVFGAQVSVQLAEDQNVQAVLSDIMRDTNRFDGGLVSLVPSVPPLDAQAAAKAVLASEHEDLHFDATDPVLVVYVPNVVGSLGQSQLVWELEVSCVETSLIREKVLVNAHTGIVVLHFSMVPQSKNRQISDNNNNSSGGVGALVRSEGDGPTGINDADLAYDYLGDVYDSYFNWHGWDSIDGFGMTLNATVRYCDAYYGCPMANAFWDGVSRMYFGDGFVADDVVAHELTHGVTTYTSDLMYWSESGAINEAFSDIWGEFIDQSNGRGTDSEAVKWLMGEDAPGGAIRSLKDPMSFQNWFPDSGYIPMPDRYKGIGWYEGVYDNEGVHHNMGVGMKLAYLLADGDNFNGYQIVGLGIPKTADLFWEAQSKLLTKYSDYRDLGSVLQLAAANLSFSQGETNTVVSALYATEILKLEGFPLRNLRATPIENQTVVSLAWDPPTYPGRSTAVTVVRKTGSFPVSTSDGTVVLNNSTDTSVADTSVALGTEYFYTVFATDPAGNAPQYARVTAGDPTPDILTEGFSFGTDLSFTQITFHPVGSLSAAEASGLPEAYVNYGDYVAAVRSTSEIGNALPIQKEDIVRLPLTDDDFVDIPLPTEVPFFGDMVSDWVLSSNGFLTPRSVYIADSMYSDVGPTISIEEHLRVPRISFLFADLDPHSGGEVWGRYLDDRAVITYENVPEWTNHEGNTVQCELFYNGQIRLTFLGLNVSRSVVGLSDGRGMAKNPVDIANHVDPPRFLLSDLSGLPPQAPFYLVPIPAQMVREGETIEFTAQAVTGFTPVTFTLESVPGAVLSATFEPINDTSYRFTWIPSSFSSPSYSFIVSATSGEFTASQWVNISVVDVPIYPVAFDLQLLPPEPRSSADLAGTYAYAQLQGYGEAGTIIYWFKNGAFLPAFTGLLSVPAEATHAGEVWNFTVRPGTFAGGGLLQGETQVSPMVTILPDIITDANKDGTVNSVDVQLVVRGALGITEDTGADVDGDGETTAVDVQHVLNATLGGGAE